MSTHDMELLAAVRRVVTVFDELGVDYSRLAPAGPRRRWPAHGLNVFHHRLDPADNRAKAQVRTTTS
jgi:hypothetical protein